MQNSTSNIFTVTQLNYSVRHLLEVELGQVWLTGEISNFSQPVSGHWYLTLKDENAQVRCAMFKMKNLRVNFRPQNGMQVLVRASVSLYEPRGDYQLIIESMQMAGDGLLQQQFEGLKMKLAAQGLFAQEHKKPIPKFVKRVGIITSPSGAALQDILHILNRRDPSLQVVIYPTLVQGKEATQDIIDTIRLANQRKECDVLIVGRGGGSLEDLWCFNEEAVAYAIYQSELPIISAVGHETDVTIADFVADLRAPTPSAAAELVSRDQQEIVRQLQHHLNMVNLAFDRLWAEKLSRFQHINLRLNAQSPAKQLELLHFKLTQIFGRLQGRLEQSLKLKEQKIAQLFLRVQAKHPSRQLELQKLHLTQQETRLCKQIEQLFNVKRQKFYFAKQWLDNSTLPHNISRQNQNLQQLSHRLTYLIEKQFTKQQQGFHALCTKLDGLSPLKILGRGYSITQNDQQHVITNTKQITKGDRITTQLVNGQILSEVIAIK
ncbi:exodeoxyribonuclease VII large subunit [Haemophilus paraphrohaemolyticus]|uniref:Exodeoxyribonuclease 7 large subunit n=1 Tax=Haemophilus paraphrohaemolyticus HK411 TaxID=1095743 RepID=I2NEB7_9PAST|nr:exodeoxyribonuclease VII large subunit [Haemophilus paraphrohaemolyticus]EIG24178.1 exodeoxyribonuclease VII, large subunit [Haemophilus paraphrohaemolyticus HK411]OOR95082.1 exodeoxyribonuclease VII large subunit [Haemophilus paraphrohaemolyticus]STP02155.1 Exodeoxyribonuclease 7 large subunit [Haemophilus paraphrohaemolyticus]